MKGNCSANFICCLPPSVLCRSWRPARCQPRSGNTSGSPPPQPEWCPPRRAGGWWLACWRWPRVSWPERRAPARPSLPAGNPTPLPRRTAGALDRMCCPFPPPRCLGGYSRRRSRTFAQNSGVHGRPPPTRLFGHSQGFRGGGGFGQVQLKRGVWKCGLGSPSPVGPSLSAASSATPGQAAFVRVAAQRAHPRVTVAPSAWPVVSAAFDAVRRPDLGFF